MPAARIASMLLVLSACHHTAEPPAIDCAPVNAAVPPGYRYKLTFVPQDLNVSVTGQELWTVPVPKQWYVYSSGGSVEPFPNSDNHQMLYGKSEIQLTTSACEHDPCPQVDAQPPDDETIIRSHDEDYQRAGHLEHRHVIVGREDHPIVPDDGIYVHVYWWTVGARTYHECTVRLAPAIRDAVDAFEKACELAIVRTEQKH